jgi:Thoeris protein ThsB, TIR-like domain
MESLFLAYNDECDSARVNHIRKQLIGTGRYRAEGYLPYTTWSKIEHGCSIDEIKRSIEEGVARAGATLILIGSEAATNPWIRYAIERSYSHKKPMIALYINELPNERGDASEADLNPLARFAVLEQGRKVYLSDRYRSYTWSDIDDGQFDLWLELARCECAERASPSRAQAGRGTTAAPTTGRRDLDTIDL